MPEQEDHPHIQDAIDEIHERTERLQTAAATLAEYGIKHAELRAEIYGFHGIAKLCEEKAKHLGLQAILHGQMTRTELGVILEVHPTTIGRWVVEQQQQAE